MLQKNIKLITETVDPGRLFQTVAEVSTYHRIQASPGFRAAAEHCAAKLNRQGIPAEVLSFPANEDTVFDTYPSFKEWSCKGGYCDIVYPFYRRIADFDRDNISVIQKSIGCDYRGEPLEVVLLDKGPNPAAYEGVDLKGKMIFVRGDINAYYDWAVVERGAVGMITDYVLQDDYVRGRYDQLDTLRYTSFWWEKGQQRTFGFVLTPREGDKLEQAIKAASAKGESVKVECFIDAELYDGSIEDVTAFIPGTTDEEIIITAHLCHPRASANDNASGVAAAMEAIRVIKDLTASGKLPPLKRGIRILLIPEFTGTYAYLDKIQGERAKILAGFNLDMVGGKQHGGYGPITLTDLPRSTPSFVGDLAVLVLEQIKQEVPPFGGGKGTPMFNSAVGGFAGGSDHMVLSDPGVGIPALMLGQWPDKFYHTSSDTLEMIDPKLLAKSCSIAAAYAYALANLEVEDVPYIMNTAMTRLTADICDLIEDKQLGKLTDEVFAAQVYRRCEYAAECAADYGRFFSDADENAKVYSMVEAEVIRIFTAASAIAGIDATETPAPCLSEEETAKYSYIPARVHFTPVQTSHLMRSFPEDIRRRHSEFMASLMAGGMGGFKLISTLMFYINGERTAAEIFEKLYLDNGSVDAEKADAYIKLMADMGFVTIK